MALFLDSARITDARAAGQLGWVSGITTNPLLLAQSELPPDETLKELADALKGEICYQLTADTLDNMLAEGFAAYNILGKQTVLKIPAVPAGFRAAALLAPQIPCAITAVYSPGQAMVARAAGARYVIPYVNRTTRILEDGPALVRSLAEVLEGSQTQILAASIKTTEEAVETAKAGAHHISMPLRVLMRLTEHDLSHRAVEEFAQSGKGIQY